VSKNGVTFEKLVKTVKYIPFRDKFIGKIPNFDGFAL